MDKQINMMKKMLGENTIKLNDRIDGQAFTVSALQKEHEENHALLSLSRIHQYEKANQVDVDKIYDIIQNKIATVTQLEELQAKYDPKFIDIRMEQKGQKEKLTTLSNGSLSKHNDMIHKVGINTNHIRENKWKLDDVERLLEKRTA